MARCTVARLMRQMGLQGRGSRQSRQDHDQRPSDAMPARPGEPAVPGAAPERALGVGLHLRRDLARASSTSPSSSTRSPGASSAGGCRARHAPASSSMPWSRRSTTAGPSRQGGLVHHSDRGVQYVSIRYTERLAEAGIEPSVGSVGDSYDNALAETINGLYKTEVIHRRGPWRSVEAVEFATLEWVDWFNNRRLLEPIGNIPPAEAEAAYYAQLEAIPMAA